MLFSKDPKLKYTDMCIYIDSHIYTDDRDDEKIFKYLYLLFYALSVKKRFFINRNDYDSYACYCATTVFGRLVNPKQFLPENDPKKLPLVKSVLNYIKKVMYPLKVNYQQSNFQQSFTVEISDEQQQNVRDELFTKARNSTNDLIQVDVSCFLSQINKTIRYLVNQLPYCDDHITSDNIYISCLLTFLKSLTWSKENLEYYQIKQNKSASLDNVINKIYADEAKSSLTLYHLPDSMGGYIKVITNRLKHMICKDMLEIIQLKQPSDSIIKAIVASTLDVFSGQGDDYND